MIRLYCAGIHSDNGIQFVASTKAYVKSGNAFTETGPLTLMSGAGCEEIQPQI